MDTVGRRGGRDKPQPLWHHPQLASLRISGGLSQVPQVRDVGRKRRGVPARARLWSPV